MTTLITTAYTMKLMGQLTRPPGSRHIRIGPRASALPSKLASRIIGFTIAAAAASCVHAAPDRYPPAQEMTVPQGTLLGTSKSIQGQLDAVRAGRTRRALANSLRVGPEATVVSPQDLQSQLGTDNPAIAAGPGDEVSNEEVYDEELYREEVEIRAPRGIPEAPLQSQIPFGLASLNWALYHPSQAWRLFLPVLG